VTNGRGRVTNAAFSARFDLYQIAHEECHSPQVSMMIGLTRSHIAVIHIVSGLLVVTHALPICNPILQPERCRCHRIRRLEKKFRWGVYSFGPNEGRNHARSQIFRDCYFRLLDSRQTTRKVTAERGKRFRAPPLFSGNNNNAADDNDLYPMLKISTRKDFLSTSIFLIAAIPSVIEAYSRVGTLSIQDKDKNDNINNWTIDKKLYSFVAPPKHTEWSYVKHVTIVFHGAGGEDAYTDELMNKLDIGTSSNSSQRQSSYNFIVDWSKYSANILQASYNGQKIGKIVAKELQEQVTSTNGKLESIHFIGISVGAFAADAAVNEVKKNFETVSYDGRNSSTGVTPPFIQLTLLDPFQQRGVFGVDYGNDEFGKSADYAEQYLNTDDPVPSTNKPLRNTVCYDVTNLRPENIFGHDWPLIYYARSVNCGRIII